MKIAIDAGHGLYTAGKRCSKEFDEQETREWTINSAVAEKVIKLLENYDCEVIRTFDITGEVDIGLSTRCKTANDFGADVFVSIHHNAAETTTATGVEVYCCRKAKEKTVEFRNLMYEELVKSNENKGNRAVGVRECNFTVLVKTNMSAVLVENGFMTSKTDVEKILSEEYQEKSAVGIVNAIVKFLDLTVHEEEKEIELVVETTNEAQHVANVVEEETEKVEKVEEKEVLKTVNIELTILKKGTISSEVKTLQRLLNGIQSSGLSVDGNFGSKTQTAVKVFQKRNNLTVDGIVGLNTWSKLLK